MLCLKFEHKARILRISIAFLSLTAGDTTAVFYIRRLSGYFCSQKIKEIKLDQIQIYRKLQIRVSQGLKFNSVKVQI